MKVLVTGSSRGIVGKNLIPLLLEDPQYNKIAQVSRDSYPYLEQHFQCNLINFTDTKYVIDIFKPDVIFHFAALSTPSSPAIDLWKNSTMTLHLLEACKNLNIKFIQASTLNINNYPTGVYTASKIACETLVYSYATLYPNIKALNIRFPAVVGANNGHGLLADVVRKVQSEGNVIELFGNYPGSLKPYVYVKDLVKIIKEVAEGDELFGGCNSGGVFNISPVDKMYVRDIADLVMSICGVTKSIKWNPDKVWKGDQPVVRAEPYHMSVYFPDIVLTSKDAITKATQDILNEKKEN